METPNTKFQTPKNRQGPDANERSMRGRLELDAWDFFGVWGLEL
jgi:hypothetical protein